MAIVRIESGERHPSKQTLIDLARELKDYFGLDWLARHFQKLHEELEIVKVPFDGLIPAGEDTEGIALEDEVSVLSSDLEGVKAARAMRVWGDSMLASNIEAGDLIIIDTSKTARSSPKGKIVVASIQPLGDDGAEAGDLTFTLKKWEEDEDKVTLVPANPCYEPREYPKDKYTVRCHGALRKVFRTVP